MTEGQISVQLTNALTETVTVPASITVQALRTLAAERLKCPSTQLKLICKGKVLREDNADAGQFGVVDGAKVLVMKSSGGPPPEVQKKEEEIEKKASEVERLTKAVQALAERPDTGDGDDYYLDLTDQHGNRVNIPQRDRKFLVQGMTLYEKGKAMLGRGEYKSALELLQLADISLQQCNPVYLSAIDNTMYLYLDIVWAMFLQRDLKRLHEAREWLKKSHELFVRAHGKYLEKVQGDAFPEKALYVRLYLLQAVVAYHSGYARDAQTHINTARTKNQELTIKDDDVAALVALRFSVKEARRALRACGSLESAVPFLTQRRAAQQERLLKEAKEEQERKEARQLPRTANGSLISLQSLSDLTAQGFPRDLAVAALRQTNNNYVAALDILLDPDQQLALLSNMTAMDTDEEALDDSQGDDANQDKQIATLAEMGFASDVAGFALKKFNHDLQAALNYLSTTPLADVEMEAIASSSSSSSSADTSSPSSLPSTASAADSGMDVSGGRVEDSEQKKAREAREAMEQEAKLKAVEEKRAIDRTIHEEIVSDLNDDPEAYLDIDLAAETAAIAEYSALIDEAVKQLPR